MRKSESRHPPISARQALVEIKDLSELMIDLSYSSALFDSRGLAREVLELGQRVDYLIHLLRIRTMVAARNEEDAESLVGVVEVGIAAQKISEAAVDVAGSVIRGRSFSPLVGHAFSRIAEQLSRLEVQANSELVSKTVSELDLEKRIGVNIIALRRRREWSVDLEHMDIRQGDVMIVRGTQEGLVALKDVTEGLSALPER